MTPGVPNPVHRRGARLIESIEHVIDPGEPPVVEGIRAVLRHEERLPPRLGLRERVLIETGMSHGAVCRRARRTRIQRPGTASLEMSDWLSWFRSAGRLPEDQVPRVHLANRLRELDRERIDYLDPSEIGSLKIS